MYRCGAPQWGTRCRTRALIYAHERNQPQRCRARLSNLPCPPFPTGGKRQSGHYRGERNTGLPPLFPRPPAIENLGERGGRGYAAPRSTPEALPLSPEVPGRRLGRAAAPAPPDPDAHTGPGRHEKGGAHRCWCRAGPRSAPGPPPATHLPPGPASSGGSRKCRPPVSAGEPRTPRPLGPLQGTGRAAAKAARRPSLADKTFLTSGFYVLVLFCFTVF